MHSLVNRRRLAQDDDPAINPALYPAFPWCSCIRDSTRSPVRVRYNGINIGSRFACFSIYIDSAVPFVNNQCWSMNVNKVEFEISKCGWGSRDVACKMGFDTYLSSPCRCLRRGQPLYIQGNCQWCEHLSQLGQRSHWLPGFEDHQLGSFSADDPECTRYNFNMLQSSSGGSGHVIAFSVPCSLCWSLSSLLQVLPLMSAGKCQVAPTPSPP
jgi:hypothetical protein